MQGTQPNRRLRKWSSGFDAQGERRVFLYFAKGFLRVFSAGALAYLGTQLLRGGLLFYKLMISPLLGPTCRFYPSCSSYALAAVEKYGMIKGTWLALLRLAKCHPWHPGGIDPLC